MSVIKMNSNHKLNLFKLFKEIQLKKQYIKKLRNKVILLNIVKKKDYTNLNSKLLSFNNLENPFKEDFLVTYIIDITFSKTNTFIHVMDFSGNLKFFCSAGFLKYKGKNKKSRFVVLKDMYKILISKLKFLKSQPISLHLKNVGFAKFWVIRLFKKKFFIKVVKSFNKYPHNGCRKKKMKRTKFKSKAT
jgi:ribosomal protein S11